MRLLLYQLKLERIVFFRGGIISSDVVIGGFCSLGENIDMGVNAHAHPVHWVSTSPFQYDRGFKNTPIYFPYSFKRKITSIGNDIWIGEGVLIMEGVSIGDGAIVAARAVVSKDVEPYTIVGGIPAKLIKQRFCKSITKNLLEKSWSNYSLVDMIGFSFNEPQDFIVQLNAKSIRKASYKNYTVARHRNNFKVRELI